MKLLKTSIIGLMVLLLAEMAFASSQQESPPLRQGEPGEFNTPNDIDKNIKPRNNKTIAPKSILTNNNENTAPSEESHSYPSSNLKSNNQFSTSKDEPIVRYTFWLTVFTGGLVFFNCLLWLFTIFLWQSTKKAADATTLNAKAVGMESPISSIISS